MESIRRGPHLPFEFGYSWQTTNGEVEHQFGPIYSRCNKRIVERVQRWLSCVDIQGSMRYFTSLNATLNWAWYQYTSITSNMDEFELCHGHEVRFGQVTNYGIHRSNGRGNLALPLWWYRKRMGSSEFAWISENWMLPRKMNLILYLLRKKYWTWC